MTNVLYDGRGILDVTGVGKLTRGLYAQWQQSDGTDLSLLAPLRAKNRVARRIEMATSLFVRRPSNWMFVPRLAPVPSLAKRNAVLIHDLGALDRTDCYPALSRREIRAVAEADIIFCISEFTAERVRYHFPNNRTIGLPFGASDVVQRQPCAKPFLLYVAADRPNKKISKLLKAWAISRLNETGWELKVVTGRTTGAPDGVQLVGKASDADVDHLFATTSGYVNVSEYEGLGLPMYQAIASKVPLLSTPLPAFEKFLKPSSRVSVAATENDVAKQLVRFTQALTNGDGAAYIRIDRTGALTDWREIVSIIEEAII